MQETLNPWVHFLILFIVAADTLHVPGACCPSSQPPSVCTGTAFSQSWVLDYLSFWGKRDISSLNVTSNSFLHFHTGPGCIQFLAALSFVHLVCCDLVFQCFKFTYTPVTDVSQYVALELGKKENNLKT